MQKLIMWFLLVFIGAASPGSSTQVIATSTSTLPFDSDWEIINFVADITLHEDTTATIIETIDVDFKRLSKHGIFRTIPVSYKTRFGNNLDIRFVLERVQDGSGNIIPVSQSRDGENVVLKIGDPNKTISGKNTYRIAYRVQQVLTRPQEQAEFYWNVTGNGWPVPIRLASARVVAPEGSILNTICFTGFFGSSSSGCTHKTEWSQAIVATNHVLPPNNGLTIATSLDPKRFAFPTTWQRIVLFLSDNWLYGVPLVTLVVMGCVYWRSGRDKQFKHLFQHDTGEIETVGLFDRMIPVAAYAPPKDLSPGEVGVLVDENVHVQDITAIVIDLAHRGFLTIKELEKKGFFSKLDFELQHAGKDESNLATFERSVLDLFFGEKRLRKAAKISRLGEFDDSYGHFQSIKKDLYHHMVKEGYFYVNPNHTRVLWFVVAGVIGFIGVAFMGFGALIGSMAGWLVVWGGSAIIIACFAPFMPARTAKGREALRQTLGLREWIRIGAWRERIHEKHNFFEEVLPYTIAFGMTEKFIHTFKEVDLKRVSEQMTWYQGSGLFSTSHFSSSFTSFGRSMSFTATATVSRHTASRGGSAFHSSGSSGGGFSGGGFGGGGGGSW